ncbi:MAG: SGNH/GDSL hydrolase family protein, partial [Desulfobaccales bacterium]
MINFKNFLKNFFLVLAGLVLSLIILEIALRVFPPFEMRFKPDRIVPPVNTSYVFDNTAKFPTKLPRTTVHTKNSLGFRGAPPPADFDDYLTLVTIGGSTTECFYLSDGRTWPDLLGAKLSRDFPKLWLNNAGLDGATTYRHLLLLEDYVVKLKPKLVLFLVGINDVGVGEIHDKPQGGFGGWLKAMTNRSEVYALGLNIYRYFVAQSRGLHHVEVDLKAQGSLDVPAEVQQETRRKYRQESLKFYRARLEKLVQVSRAQGIEPVLITQPTLYGPGIDPVTGVDLEKVKLGENLNGALMYAVVEMYNGTLRRVGSENGVLVIDLAREMPRNSAYYYDYLHYTEAGAAE